MLQNKTGSQKHTVSQYTENDQSIPTLKSMFQEYKMKSDTASVQESDEILYKIVPIFYKIFYSTAGHEISEKFPEVFLFCKFASSLMVKEIKRRATNQKTEEASLAIVHFLQPSLLDTGLKANQDDSRGWQLLTVIGILSRGPASFIDSMISSGLPSTLVKCLYIFFDLPDIQHQQHQQFTSHLPPSVQHINSFSPTVPLYSNESIDDVKQINCNICDQFSLQRRSILMDLFKQIIQRICFYPIAIEELVRKEDLRLLFGAVASWCPNHNSGWRKIAADVLQTIAHNGLSQNTIQHIYHKKLISQCLKNISKGGLKSMEIVDIFVTLFHILRESSDINQTLLDDFRNSQGYVVIEEFLIKLEKEISNDSEKDSIQSLIILIGKLTTCGYVELKPKQSIMQDLIYEIEGFELPMPINKNESIRNYYAFHVLQSVFLNAETDFLCLKILDGIKCIYKQDPANYFILEPQNTFQVFSEKICEKSFSVQKEFFSLIICIVENLNYVPIKEISSTAVILKTSNETYSKILLIQLYIDLLKLHKVFKDVLRDLGILELSVNLLHGYVYNLKESFQRGSERNGNSIQDENEELGILVIHLLTLLIHGVSKNIELFKKIGGSGCIYSLINLGNGNRRSQIKALLFLKTLTISSGSEEDMTSFLSLVRSTSPNNLNLKCWVLFTLYCVLKESHRCRIIFRKVHSYILLIQEIVHLEGRLSIYNTKNPQLHETELEDEEKHCEVKYIFEYIEFIMDILTVSFRKEPSNVRYFSYNVGYASLTESLKNLGIFGTDIDLISIISEFDFSNLNLNEDVENIKTLLNQIFEHDPSYSFLFDMQLTVESRQALFIGLIFKIILNHTLELFNETVINEKYECVSMIEKEYLWDDQPKKYDDITKVKQNYIIHPEGIITLLHLIPAVRSDTLPMQLQILLQTYMLEMICKLLEEEHNMHLMTFECAETTQELLSSFQIAMIDDKHPLHDLSMVLFERLAANRISPRNLRDFLRLGDPLCCKIDLKDCSNFSNQFSNGGPLSLNHVKSLINITSQHIHRILLKQEDSVLIPKSIYSDHWINGDDYHQGKYHQHESQCFTEMQLIKTPPFVEINMRSEGFGCLFLPSIAPQNVSAGVAGSVGLVSPLDTNTIGGIGVGERAFPPTSGFSFSSWFSIQQFCSLHSHPVRLLTIMRNLIGTNDSVVCLSVNLLNVDSKISIIVSTMETPLTSKEMDFENSSDVVVNFQCDQFIVEKSWIHLVLSFQRSGMIKHSSCSCFLNGQFIGCKKLNYISNNMSTSSNILNNGSLIKTVHAFIGTLPIQQKTSNLCWRQGPLHLIEEPISAQTVSIITRLGPNYFGNFQNPLLANDNSISHLVAEEKIVFSLFANNISILTLPKIHKIYNEIDANIIARQLHLHPKEKSSPIRIIHNASDHLSGTARTLGAVLIGHESVQCFTLASLSSILDCVGGTNILLGIIAMSESSEYLYAALNLFCSTLIDNKYFLDDFENNVGYKLLNYLLKKKIKFLTIPSIQLLINLCGCDKNIFSSISSIKSDIQYGTYDTIDISNTNRFFNKRLFDEVICDLELWIRSDIYKECNRNELLLYMLNQIYDFVKYCVEIKLLGFNQNKRENCGENDDMNDNLKSVEKQIRIDGARANYILRFILNLKLLDKLLFLIMQFKIDIINDKLCEKVFDIIYLLLLHSQKDDDIKLFGQFIIWTLPELGSSEYSIKLSKIDGEKIDIYSNVSQEDKIFYKIKGRNRCFHVLIYLLERNDKCRESEIKGDRFGEILINQLGFDWVCLFLKNDINSSTVILAMKCLYNLLIIPGFIQKFRDGAYCSPWLSGTEVVLKKRHGLLLMDNSKEQITSLRELNLEACHQPGFIILESLLPVHYKIPELYFILIAILLGNKIKSLPENLKFEFENICAFLFGSSDSKPTETLDKVFFPKIWNSGSPIGDIINKTPLKKSDSKCENTQSSIKKPSEMCPDAAMILLAMMKEIMVNQINNVEENIEWICDYPITLLRFFVYLYHTNSEFQTISMQSDFLIGLTQAMYPFVEITNNYKISREQVKEGIQEASLQDDINSVTITSDLINQQPARKLIMDFFKTIILDYFTMIPYQGSCRNSNSISHIIDILMDVDIKSNSEHIKQFRTIFFNNIIEHLLAVDILSGENLPLPEGGNYNNIPNNVFYLMSRIVDKVWQDEFIDEPIVVLNYFSRFLMQSKKKELQCDPLYRSYNRTILYMLWKSYNEESPSFRSSALIEIFHKIMGNNNSEPYIKYILHANNNDSDFFVCFAYFLIQILKGTNTIGESTWYKVDCVNDSRNATKPKESLNYIQNQHSLEILDLVDAIWKELYSNKKSILEESFKQQISPNLELIYNHIESVCVRTWTSYLELETVDGNTSYGNNQIWGRISSYTNPSTSSNNSGLHYQLSQKFKIRSSVLSRFSGNSTLMNSSFSTNSNSSSNTIGLSCSSISAAKMMSQISFEESKLWIPPHISVVKELVEFYKNELLKKEAYMVHYFESNWKLIEIELTRERGIWGPLFSNNLDKWMLDSSEGPCRMRKKMIHNYLFYETYPYNRPKTPFDNSDPGFVMKKFKAASSLDSKIHFERSLSRIILKECNQEYLNNCGDENQYRNKSIQESITDDPEESLRTTETLLRGRKTSIDISFLKDSEKLLNDCDQDDDFKEDEIDKKESEIYSSDNATKHLETSDSSISDNVLSENYDSEKSRKFSTSKLDASKKLKQNSYDNQAAIEHLIGLDERIHFMFRCARIQGLEVLEGLLLFGQSHFYIIDGFTLLKTREIVEIDDIPSDVHEPIVPLSNTTSSSFSYDNYTSGNIFQRKRINEKFSFEEIREIHKRRYLLQPIAIEVFLADGRNLLLAFPKKMQNKIYSKFIQISPFLVVNSQMSISGQKQSLKIESSAPGILSSLIGEKSVTQRWERGEISNFQYLMHLNTLAGRSYNDLMQYPVFPWVLADYSSDVLDLTKPSTFRRLDRPMGAQTEPRQQQFEKRFREWDDPSGETPPYHYGTHYSSAMIVAFYLVRMEPFAQHFLKLQGGHFDLADRMFHSIKDTWESASQHNMADIKELIPEFYYLPNFLLNTNNFDLGVKQSGTRLGDVILPPWAKNDTREFIRMHREALECDYVSAHLHEWIDLIFGYKQLGEPAVESVNVFHHLFYEGNVDIYTIDDPLKRSAVIGFINNFGQIPKQLFKKPHPPKRMTLPMQVSQLPLSMNSGDSIVPMASSAIAERLFYHNLDNLEPSLQPVKELKNAVGQIIHIDPNILNGGAGLGGSAGTMSMVAAVGGYSDNSSIISGSSGNSNAAMHVNSNNVLAVEQNKCLIPSTFTRYVAWGFSDGSIRIGNYDSDKLIKVYEMPDPYGDILCVVCPNEKILVTGGVSTVVKVWSIVNNNVSTYVKNKLNTTTNSGNISNNSSGGLSQHLKLLANLYGHREAVTCVSAASKYNILVSGSRDRTCIIWDLARLCFLHQLSGHAAPVAAIAISEISGRIASCAGTHLYLWDIDGTELASVNTATGRSKQILCVTMSTMLDWDPSNVIITGGTDGVVRMWSLEYTQVPLSNNSIEPKSTFDISKIDRNTISETELPENEENYLDEEAKLKLPRSDTTKSEDHVSNYSQSKSTQSSKNSVEEEYIVINSNEINQTKPDNDSKKDCKVLKSVSQPQLTRNYKRLKSGFYWQRQLIFRSKLTMHTAYERTDNANPSPVTSIAISRDHRTVLVGDQKGRIFYWSVPNEPGRTIADHWIRDENAESCKACYVKFSLTERRHHCRNCGMVFCNKCSKFEIEIHRLRLFKPVRVCQNCYTFLNEEQQYNNPLS